MLGRRSKPPVLAELAPPRRGGKRPGALDRTELEGFADLSKAVGASRSVLVTGSGRTRVALGLATAATVAGKRVALLECDLEEPALAKALGLSASPGLHEYLRREVEPAQILQSLVLAGPASSRTGSPLVCVVAGKPAPDAEELLLSAELDHAIEKLRHAYDLLVIDGPPLGAGKTPLRAVSERVDTTLLCGVDGQLPKKLPIPVTGLVVQGA